MVGPLIHKRKYGNIYDYIIIFDSVPDGDVLPEIGKDVWVSLQINKKLDLSKFKCILKGYHTHRFYRDTKYHLFFNNPAKQRLPVYNPVLRMHEHVSVKLLVGDQKLKVKSLYGNSWRYISGGVNCFEKPENAVKRELREELGISYSGEIHLLSSKYIKMNIPILNKHIKTKMYFYLIKMEKLPSITVDKRELSQVKLGDKILWDGQGYNV